MSQEGTEIISDNENKERRILSNQKAQQTWGLKSSVPH